MYLTKGLCLQLTVALDVPQLMGGPGRRRRLLPSSEHVGEVASRGQCVCDAHIEQMSGGVTVAARLPDDLPDRGGPSCEEDGLHLVRAVQGSDEDRPQQTTAVRGLRPRQELAQTTEEASGRPLLTTCSLDSITEGPQHLTVVAPPPWNPASHRRGRFDHGSFNGLSDDPCLVSCIERGTDHIW